MRTKQLSFFPTPQLKHGGSLGVGKRKRMRPLDPKRPVHLVLRSSRAHGQWSLLSPRHEKQIRILTETHAKRTSVRIYQYANSGNHLHLLVKASTREGFRSFLRIISGLIARLVTGAKKGKPQGKFWDALAFTRVVSWGKAYLAAKFYVIQNEMEAAGVWHRSLNMQRPKPG